MPPICLQNPQVRSRRTFGEDPVLFTDSPLWLRLKKWSLPPLGHWLFLSLEVLVGQSGCFLRNHVLGLWGAGVSSGHIQVPFSPTQAAGQDLVLLVKGWDGGQLCWFDPSVDLSSWNNSMATECNLISSRGLLHATLLAHPGNKKEAVDDSAHIIISTGRKPQNLWPFSQRPHGQSGSM